MPRRGRPLGELSKTVLAALAAQPRSSRQLAVDLQASTRLMTAVVSELRCAGHVVVVDSVRDTRGRLVAVFAPVQSAQDRSGWPTWLR